MEIAFFIAGYGLFVWFLWWGYRKIAAHLDHHAALKRKVGELTENNRHLLGLVSQLEAQNRGLAERIKANQPPPVRT